MKIKKGDLFDAQTIVAKKLWLGDMQVLPKLPDALAMGEILWKLIDELNIINERREEIISKYAKRDKKGQKIVSDGRYVMKDEAGYEKDWDALASEEIETEPLQYEWMRTIGLCMAEIRAIGFLLE